jgi:hypothetical protein
MHAHVGRHPGQKPWPSAAGVKAEIWLDRHHQIAANWRLHLQSVEIYGQ